MSAELANLNHRAVPFLSRAAVNLCWYRRNLKRDVTEEYEIWYIFTLTDKIVYQFPIEYIWYR